MMSYQAGYRLDYVISTRGLMMSYLRLVGGIRNQGKNVVLQRTELIYTHLMQCGWSVALSARLGVVVDVYSRGHSCNVVFHDIVY